LGQNRVLEDDQIFLHLQERQVAAKGGSATYQQACYLPTKADLFVAKFREWVTQYHVNPFPGKTLPPRLVTNQLMDRYHSHTQHCQSCRTALANIEKIQTISAAIAIICLSLLPILVVSFAPNWGLGIGLSLTTAIAFGIWAGLGKFKRSFYQGHPIPPRNLPDKR
jgi:phenylpropionate dioxygenase-like ring-hydroxylating dioxygenase large terminal subunit